ncbi:MarR family winged helix-turn-helix transcriptional regulator [Streptomyces fuscigenes]|uniref:MarR family winged helix-turn-helix transcriptional regulator n=1 Tax=Streptomyces fuscigenes TaxID=1528880 RepID=UPI001F3ED0CD|nr:MarR family transcriptional regulator [Streptomyces fuscigenes]MCF3964608.1 MarR family transcriptional regulator [Streptomyces fuscigenes]
MNSSSAPGTGGGSGRHGREPEAETEAGTEAERPGRDPRDREIASVLRRGTTRLGTRMRAERPPGALSGNKIGVLGHLHRKGPSTAGAVAAASFQRPQSLTRVLAELERDGLIVRARGERDGRQVLLALTEQGRDALGADMRARDAWLTGALDSLTATEREVLRLAGALMERLAEEP